MAHSVKQKKRKRQWSIGKGQVMCNLKKYIIFLLFAVVFLSSDSFFAAEVKRDEDRIISLNEFIALATLNDKVFEEILIEELTLQYRKDLALPSRDIVLSVKADYDFFLTQDREDPEGSVALNKLFPYTGTDVGIEYSSSTSFNSRVNSSEFSVAISQPIAGNAFGRVTRLQDKIIGVEIDVIKHQVIEAYEDYLSGIIMAYYDWYAAYENARIGQSAYDENLKLLQNIEGRRKSSIALPIDVNKIKLQVLAKKEKLIELTQEYESMLNFIQTAMRFTIPGVIVPKEPDVYGKTQISFERDFGNFWRDSRTYQVLELLKTKTSLELDKEADDLLPSINLRFGYTMDGDDLEIDNDEGMVYAGISLEWPFSDSVDRAEHETAKIALKKTSLSTANAHYKLFQNIKNLSLQIDKEKQLVQTGKEKIDLAQAILKDEEENYSYGKVTLNDYIVSVNVLDSNRFNLIAHSIEYNKLIVEWLRITDRLIGKKELDSKAIQRKQ